MKANEYYKTKLVNTVNQEWHLDGTVTIRIYKEGWKRTYTFKARKLYEKDEVILEDEDLMEEVV